MASLKDPVASGSIPHAGLRLPGGIRLPVALPAGRALALPAGWIDLARAAASQLIVWHHFALYGPLCDTASALAPALADALVAHARLVVQVFLVIGGFLAAASLWPAPGEPPRLGWRELPARAWQRYQRLARPYLVAVLAAILGALLARRLIEHPTIPAPPEGWQLVAHLLLLQDVLGMEALSAGFWYVAIDLQLFLAWAALAALAGTLGAVLPRRARALLALVAVVAVTAGSLFAWNRDTRLDTWAPYFAGAYGLGALACWARRLPARGAAALALLAFTGLALVVEWRSRIALAGATAAVLVLLPARLPGSTRAAWHRAVAGLARISYPVFLLHYPVLLVVGALVHTLWPDDAWAALAGLLAAWVGSLAAGAAVQRILEPR